jgi:hypothetical protein
VQYSFNECRIIVVIDIAQNDGDLFPDWLAFRNPLHEPVANSGPSVACMDNCMLGAIDAERIESKIAE